MSFSKIEVKEISLLQEDFEIECRVFQVVVSDAEKQQNSDTSENGKSSNSLGTDDDSTSVIGTVTPKIQIPRTGIKYTIYDKMTVQNMEKGVVISSTQNGLNQPGNTVISGHNTVNGRLFSNNYKIKKGDLIYITDSTGNKVTYSVYKTYQTFPNDASFYDRDTNGAREISLTTCTNNSKKRIIIWAKEK